MIEKIKIQMDKRIGDITTIPNAWQDYFQVRYDKQGHFVSIRAQGGHTAGIKALWLFLHHHIREDDCIGGADPLQGQGCI